MTTQSDKVQRKVLAYIYANQNKVNEDNVLLAVKNSAFNDIIHFMQLGLVIKTSKKKLILSAEGYFTLKAIYASMGKRKKDK